MTRTSTPIRIPGSEGVWVPWRLPGDGAGWRSLAELLTAAESAQKDDVWLADELLPALGLPAELEAGAPPHPWLAGLDEAGWETRTDGLASHGYYYRKGGAGIDVNVPAWSDPEAASPFAGLGTDALLHEALRLREATHGLVTWKGRATLTSDALIRRTTRGLVASPLPVPVLHGRGGELPHAWTAAAGSYDGGNPRLRAPRNCYAYDLNLAYLNGASSLALGCGEMVPAAWDGAPRGGWWEVEPPGWRTDTLPPPWSVRGRRFLSGDAVWVTTPTAKYLNELGGFIRSGYAFTESHRFLERWYKTLRDARAELLHDGGAAYVAVKQIAQHGLGRLGSLRRRLEDRDPLYQPYWREAVVAEMRVRLLRRLVKLRRYPVAVDVDCAYFLTNATSPEGFAEWAGLPLGDGLGQFKFAGRCPGRIAREALEVGGTRALVTLREATND